MTVGNVFQQVGYLFFSFLSSVSIIFINKYIYTDKRVAGTLLMSFHFMTCFIVSYILYVLNNLFKNTEKETTSEHQVIGKDKELSLSTKENDILYDEQETEIFSLFKCNFMTFSDGILFSLSVSSALLFGNLSLIHNSISVYQLSKLMVIPCLITINVYYFNMKMDKKIGISLIFIVLGMMLVIGFDIIMNWFGSVICLFAIVTGATSQITINHFCKKYKMNGFELLLNHSLFSSIVMAVLSLPIDGFDSIAYSTNLFNGNSSFFLAVLTSGFAAFFVNVSGYLVIGKLSPLTFQVLGHAKTISVLIGGYFLFGSDKDLSIHTILGISIALVGTFFYSYFKFQEETLEKPNESVLNEKETIDVEHVQLELGNTTLSFVYQPLADSGNTNLFTCLERQQVILSEIEDERSHYSQEADNGMIERNEDEMTNYSVEKIKMKLRRLEMV